MDSLEIFSERPQRMKLNDILGDTLASPSGSLPGCVVAQGYIFYRRTCQEKP